MIGQRILLACLGLFFNLGVEQAVAQIDQFRCRAQGHIDDDFGGWDFDQEDILAMPNREVFYTEVGGKRLFHSSTAMTIFSSNPRRLFQVIFYLDLALSNATKKFVQQNFRMKVSAITPGRSLYYPSAKSLTEPWAAGWQNIPETTSDGFGGQFFNEDPHLTFHVTSSLWKEKVEILIRCRLDAIY